MKKLFLTLIMCLMMIPASVFAENSYFNNPEYSTAKVGKMLLTIVEENSTPENFVPIDMAQDIFYQELADNARKRNISVVKDNGENAKEPADRFNPDTVKLNVYLGNVGTLRHYYALSRRAMYGDYRRGYRYIPRKEYNPHTGEWEVVPVPVYDNRPVITYDSYAVVSVVYEVRDIATNDLIYTYTDFRERQNSDPRNLVKRSVKAFYDKF